MGRLCEVVPAEHAHVRHIGVGMRPEDALEATCCGIMPRLALRRSFFNAIISRTLLVDGEPAAIWGLGGVVLNGTAEPWLITTPLVEKVPVTFVKWAEDEIDRMLAMYPRLENNPGVAAFYRRSIKFLLFLGFTIDPPKPVGPQGSLFHRFWMER